MLVEIAREMLVDGGSKTGPRLGAFAAVVLGLSMAALPGPPAHARAPSITLGPGSYAGPRVDPEQEERRGEAALRAGAYRDAEDAFRRVTEQRPSDADAWYNLGAAASGLGEISTAARAYGRSVSLDPTSIESRRDLALTQVRMKQNQKAAVQLDALKALAAACKDPCPQAYELRAAIAMVEGALSN